jgi:hypothetical protein
MKSAKLKMQNENCDRVNAELRRGPGYGECFADWKSAIRQVGNLRYKEAAL